MTARSLVTSFLMALLFVTRLTAAAIGADVKQISFDPKTGIAIFEIRNLGTKNIAAFNLSFDAVYADGKTSHGEQMVDFWPGMMTRRIELGDLSPGTALLHPGGTEQETIGSGPFHNGSPLQSINAALDVIVYEDQSAVVTNKDAFGRVAAARKARANTIAQVAAILSKYLASDENDPVTAAKVDLQNLASYAQSRPEELMHGDIMSAIDALNHIPKGVTKRDFLADYVEQKNKHVTESAAAARIEAQQ